MYRLILILFFLLITNCSSTTDRTYKSPCTSINGGPCDRYSVNDWWLNGESQPRLVKTIV